MGIRTNYSNKNLTMSAAAPKVKKAPRAPAAHPKYSVMIAAAITTLKDRLALKRGVAKGALKMARASGKGAGSYKVVKVKKPKKATKKPAAKKPAKKAAKKPAAKKAAKKPAKKAAKK